MLRLLRQISARQLARSWGRTALVVGGIATGTSLIVAINVINTSVLASFRATLERLAGPAQLEVTLGLGEVGFPESTVEIVRNDPDVATAIPLVRGTVALAEDPAEAHQLFGADLTTEEDLERYRISLDTDRGDVLAWLNDPRSVALTEEFAAEHGLDVGQSVELTTPEGVRAFTIRGLLEPEGLARAFGGRLVLMDLPAAQLLLAKERRIDQIDLLLRPDADVADARRRLEARLPSTLSVSPPAQRGEHYERVFASFQAMLAGISTICLVAGIFIVYNTTSTATAQRAPVMARLLVIGATESQLLRLLLCEAVILGALGTVMGMSAGLGLASLLSRMVADSMGIIFQLRFSADALAVDRLETVLVAGMGVAAATIASYSAARQAAATEPLEALRPSKSASSLSVEGAGLVRWWVAVVAVSVCALVGQERYGSPTLGNLGATLWNASVIVIAIPLVGWLGAGLRGRLPHFFGAEGRMAIESLTRSPTRVGVTAAAIGLVLTLGIMLSSLSLSFRESMRDYVGRVLAGDLVLSAVTTEGGWLETPLPERVVADLQAVPGVAAVESLRVIPGQQYRGLRIAVGGLSDGFFDPARFPSHWYREGDATTAAAAIRAGQGANVSTGLSDRTGLHVGDRIELDTPTGVLTLPIVGVVPDYASDRGSVLMSRNLLAERWHERTVNRVNVTIAPNTDLEAVRKRILDRFGKDFRLKVLSLREVLAYHDRMINRAFAFTHAIQLLVIVVTVAGILDLLLSRIIERRRELALWEVIGATERCVRRSVLIESVTIGALGAVLGIMVGLVTSWIWVRFNFRHLLGYDLEAHFALGTALWYALLVLIMTGLAGYAATVHALRQDVVEGIQIE